MHTRTEELRAIISRAKMTSKDISELLGVKENTVNCWRSTVKVIPEVKLELLKLKLGAMDE